MKPWSSVTISPGGLSLAGAPLPEKHHAESEQVCAHAVWRGMLATPFQPNSYQSISYPRCHHERELRHRQSPKIPQGSPWGLNRGSAFGLNRGSIRGFTNPFPPPFTFLHCGAFPEYRPQRPDDALAGCATAERAIAATMLMAKATSRSRLRCKIPPKLD